MGIKTGYYYSCKKCGAVVQNDIFLFQHLNPINFDYLIKECYSCGTKYLNNSNEFFTVHPSTYCKWLISSLITWLLWIFVIVGGIIAMLESYNAFIILCIFCVLFIPIYSFNFKKRYDKAITKSMKRIDDASYLYDLLQYGILNFNNVVKFHDDGIISTKIYNDLIYNMKASSENNQELELLINRLEEENKTK